MMKARRECLFVVDDERRAVDRKGLSANTDGDEVEGVSKLWQASLFADVIKK